jgi:hypothetical protein
VLSFSREPCSDASNSLRDCFINVGANLCQCSGFDNENKPRGRGRTKVLTYLNIRSHGARGRMDDCGGFFSNRVIGEYQVIWSFDCFLRCQACPYVPHIVTLSHYDLLQTMPLSFVWLYTCACGSAMASTRTLMCEVSPGLDSTTCDIKRDSSV